MDRLVPCGVIEAHPEYFRRLRLLIVPAPERRVWPSLWLDVPVHAVALQSLVLGDAQLLLARVFVLSSPCFSFVNRVAPGNQKVTAPCSSRFSLLPHEIRSFYACACSESSSTDFSFCFVFSKSSDKIAAYRLVPDTERPECRRLVEDIHDLLCAVEAITLCGVNLFQHL